MKNKLVRFSDFFFPWLGAGGALLLAALPLGCLIVVFYNYAVDIPVWDEWWGVVPLLQKYFSGALHPGDFWAQHNEHRLVFPKLLLLGLALVSDYDVRWDMVASIAFALLFYACIGMHLFLNRRALGMERSWIWLWTLAAYAVFSLRQHENWFWGFQVQWYMNVAGMALGAFVLTNKRMTPKVFVLLVCCGVFSLFSLSAGALYWVLVPVFLLLMQIRGATIPHIRTYIALWCALFVALLFFYFLNLERGYYPGGLFHFFEAPGDSVRYVLLYLAGMLTEINSTNLVSLLLGASGLAVFLFGGAWILWWANAARCRASLFFLFLGCYAIGCALITGIGRSGFGVEQASASRYTTISMLLWLAVFYLLFAAVANSSYRGWKEKLRGAALVLLLCASFGGVVYSGYTSLPYIRFASTVYSEARFAFKNATDPRIMQNICNDPDVFVLQARPFMQRNKLSVFRDAAQ